RTSRRLVEQIDALTKIATEFSSFAKMPDAVNEYVSIGELVESVHQLFAREAVHMEFVLNRHYPPPDSPQNLYVYADRDQLLRVLNNLYKNAIQAIPEDRIGRIQTDVVIAGREWVKIAVADNGTGILPEQQKKVFVPNFTTKSSGTGLGLAMSKNIVEMAKGQIYFETKAEEGTVFFIELPLSSPEAG
ncbi:MAG: ATP-binding protein, partial [Bacteroidota bacterium]